MKCFQCSFPILNRQKLVLWAMLLAVFSACSPALKTTLYSLPTQTNTPQPPNQRRGPNANGCSAWEGYVPDTAHNDHLRIKYLRVNFHIINSLDSSQNFKPDAGRAYFRELLANANANLDTNELIWRSNDTPILPKRYRYVLTPQPGDDGIYFHFDDSLYWFVSMGRYQNNYSRAVIDKYGIGLDSIINIFVQVHPADSIKSKQYRANGQGIALGNGLKMAGIFESKEPTGSFDGLLNHEIGHILGLGHAWVADGCADTKEHDNRCWNWTPTPPCNEQATNNMMDYNAYQISMTPCQIGKVHAVFANERSPVRKCLVPNWCTLHSDREIIIRDSIVWSGARDLEGNLTIAAGGSLQLNCRVSVPPNGKITVQPGGRLLLNGCRLHNACGKNWQGIFVQENKTAKGVVEILKQPEVENIAALKK